MQTKQKKRKGLARVCLSTKRGEIFGEHERVPTYLSYFLFLFLLRSVYFTIIYYISLCSLLTALSVSLSLSLSLYACVSYLGYSVVLGGKDGKGGSGGEWKDYFGHK